MCLAAAGDCCQLAADLAAGLLIYMFRQLKHGSGTIRSTAALCGAGLCQSGQLLSVCLFDLQTAGLLWMVMLLWFWFMLFGAGILRDALSDAAVIEACEPLVS